MKKVILLIALAVGITTTANAQEKKFIFGLRAGVNIPSFSDDDAKNAVGFHVGAVGDIMLGNSMFFLQPGLYFSMKGSKFDAPKDPSIALYYAELPVLFSYHLVLGESVKVFINAGPYFAVGVGGKYKLKNGGETRSFDAFGDEENALDLHRFDFGLNAGLGISIMDFYAGANYELGLTNVTPSDFSEKWKNRSINISVGYNF